MPWIQNCYLQNSDQKNRTDSEFSFYREMKLKYRSNWNYEQIDVAENTKYALSDGHIFQNSYDPPNVHLPAFVGIRLMRRKCLNRRVENESDGIK